MLFPPGAAHMSSTLSFIFKSNAKTGRIEPPSSSHQPIKLIIKNLKVYT